LDEEGLGWVELGLDRVKAGGVWVRGRSGLGKARRRLG